MEENTYTLVYAPEKSETNFSHHIYEFENPNDAENLDNKGTQVGLVAKVKNQEPIGSLFFAWPRAGGIRKGARPAPKSQEKK